MHGGGLSGGCVLDLRYSRAGYRCVDVVHDGRDSRRRRSVPHDPAICAGDARRVFQKYGRRCDDRCECGSVHSVSGHAGAVPCGCQQHRRGAVGVYADARHQHTDCPRGDCPNRGAHLRRSEEGSVALPARASLADDPGLLPRGRGLCDRRQMLAAVSEIPAETLVPGGSQADGEA